MPKKYKKYFIEESPQGGWNVWMKVEHPDVLVVRYPTRKQASRDCKVRNRDHETRW